MLDVDLDLALTGFSSGEIDVILKGPADPEDEVIPAVPATPRTRPGDIWILGEHRVGCGDGRDLAFLQAVVGDGAVVDAAFLDPPYNVRINGHANARGRHPEFAMASGEMSTAAFRSFLADTLGACARVSRDGAVHFVCIDWRHVEDVTAVGRSGPGAGGRGHPRRRRDQPSRDRGGAERARHAHPPRRAMARLDGHQPAGPARAERGACASPG